MKNPTMSDSADLIPRARESSAASGREAARELARWYGANARDLPWRASRDPYRVLVSEVMLQQTTVETVIPYFRRFIDAFPDVGRLAAAPEKEVLRFWSGLGYYRRARNLREAASRIVVEHRGRVPDEMAALRRLPGIGHYTASALLAIAHGRPELALDGNLRRVLARWIAFRGDPRSPDGEERLTRAGKAIVASGDPSVLNQALMDLGSGVCTPRSPRCSECPIRGRCAARALGIAEEIPARARKEEPVAITLAAGVIRRGGRVLVRRRAGDLMRGLWEFPMTEVADGSLPGDDLTASLLRSEGIVLAGIRSAGTIRHSITRHRLRVHVYDADGASVHASGRRDGAASDPPAAWAIRERAPMGRVGVEGRSASSRLEKSPAGGARSRKAGQEEPEAGEDRRHSPGSRIAGEYDRSAARWVRESEIGSLPLTGIARKILDRIEPAARGPGKRAGSPKSRSHGRGGSFPSSSGRAGPLGR